MNEDFINVYSDEEEMYLEKALGEIEYFPKPFLQCIAEILKFLKIKK